jgi:hypothetical protein
MPPPDGTSWGGRRGPQSFQQVLADAIRDLSATGYVSSERVATWITALRNAAERELGSEAEVNEAIKRGLGAQFARFVDGQKLLQRVPDLARWNLQSIKPKLHAELDRRIHAATDLIKLRRQEAVSDTLRRLSGWATSIPPGGDDTVDQRETRTAIGKSMAQFRFEKRRCEIDQGFKLISNISEITANEAGAIAGVWHDHGEHDRSYNARKEHMERAEKIFLVRDSWAHQQGLVKPIHGYTDEITKPGQEVYCRCYYRWITSPRRLPDEMLTRKGQEWIERGRLDALRRAA